MLNVRIVSTARFCMLSYSPHGFVLNLFGIARFEVNYCIPVPLTNQNSGYVSSFVDAVTHTGYEWMGNLIVETVLTWRIDLVH